MNMPIHNEITPEKVSRINASLQAYEEAFYRRDDAKAHPDKDLWEVFHEGMRKIEESPTKHLMFTE